MARPTENDVTFCKQTRDVRAVDQRRKGRDQLDTPFIPLICRQRRPSPASRARLQLRQLPAHAGDSRTDQRLVADQPEGIVDHDLGRRSSAMAAMSPSRWQTSPFQETVRRHPAADRRTAAAVPSSAFVKYSLVMHSSQTHVRDAS
jgi:hypothetical protein